MNTTNIEQQLKLIQAKIILQMPLSAFEQAYYALYGNRLTEEK